MNPKPTIGRIVGYVLPVTHSRAGQVVPAVITRTWGGTTVQLTPFVDVANDTNPTSNECSSVAYDAAGATPRTWHWLPRE
ncbi:MAG: hypothetical protein JNK23_10605 [Opitutaceae bacterium]|nr:hypothetical protein [Opitutaceae bacterium]